MAIASRIQDYMAEHGCHYEVLTHAHSHNSMQTAQLAHVPGERLAKSVMLEDDEGGFVMAVIPSSHHVRLGQLSRELNRPLHLATEDELPALFSDCERGAIPPVGMAYGISTVVDDSLAEQPDVYFEAGDHELLIHMEREDFMHLMDGAAHGRFCDHTWHGRGTMPSV